MLVRIMFNGKSLMDVWMEGRAVVQSQFTPLPFRDHRRGPLSSVISTIFRPKAPLVATLKLEMVLECSGVSRIRLGEISIPPRETSRCMRGIKHAKKTQLDR